MKKRYLCPLLLLLTFVIPHKITAWRPNRLSRADPLAVLPAPATVCGFEFRGENRQSMPAHGSLFPVHESNLPNRNPTNPTPEHCHEYTHVSLPQSLLAVCTGLTFQVCQ